MVEFVYNNFGFQIKNISFFMLKHKPSGMQILKPYNICVHPNDSDCFSDFNGNGLVRVSNKFRD